MNAVRRVVWRLNNTLDAGTALVEFVISFVMMIGATSAIRYAWVEPEPERENIVIGALFVVVAWAIIDAANYLLGSLFRQGRVRRLARRVQAAKAAGRPDEPRLRAETLALADGTTWDLLPQPELDAIADRVVELGLEHRPVRLTSDDWFGAWATLSAMSTPALALLPFLLPLPLADVVWISNGLAVLALFWIGWFWARWTDYPRWLCGTAIASVGLAAVAITLLLGVE